MTAEVLSILVFAVVLVVVCWMFAEYWISVRSRGTGEDVGKLRFGSRTAFALTHFWKAVDDAGDIPKEKLRNESCKSAGGRPQFQRSAMQHRTHGRYERSGSDKEEIQNEGEYVIHGKRNIQIRTMNAVILIKKE